MSEVIIGRCEYCHKENVPIIATPEIDLYCIECHRLTRDNCNEAIRQIKDFQKEHKCRVPKKKESLDELRKNAEDALFALTGEKISLD